MAMSLLTGFYRIGLVLLILGLYSHSASGAVLNPVNGVQRGTATLASGSTTATVSISPVNVGQSILWFQASHNLDSPADGSVSGQITNGTTLTFSRVGNSGAVTIQWHVTQFSSGVSVQRGTTVKTGSPTLNVPINAVNLSRTFVLIGDRHSGSTYNSSSFTRARLTSSTNLELSIVGTSTSSPDIVEWQVVEIQSGASVQSGLVSFGTSASSVTASISAINPASSFLIFNYRSAAGTSSNIGQKMVRGRITSNSQLTFDRSSTGQAIDLSWFVVSWTDGTAVQSGSANFTSSQTVSNVTIAPVNPGRSISFSGANPSAIGQGGGRTAFTTNDNPGVAAFRHLLTTPTNLQLTRGGTGGAADVGWFVVQFFGPHPPANLDAADTPGDTGGSISLLHWNVSPSPGVTEQRIYRSTNSGGPYTTPIAVIPDNVTSSYVDNSGLTNGTRYYYVIRAYDGFNESVNSNEASAVPIDNNPPVITTTTLPDTTVGANYSQTLASTGGSPPLIWGVAGGSLPAGLTLSSSTGIISGTATAAGNSTFSAQVTDANGSSDFQTLSIMVNAAPAVTTTGLPGVDVGAAYNQTLAAGGGTAPLAWSRISGALPAGLTLNGGGVISGTPTTSGTSHFTVRVTDANGVFDDQPLSIAVNATSSLTITTTSLPEATLTAAYSQSLTATGGTAPFVWAIQTGTLPAGLTLNGSTGVISGTPTAPGTSHFTVRVTDATSAADDQALSIVVNGAPVVTTTALMPGAVGAVYSQTLTVSGGGSPLTWSLWSGSLPDGLNFSSGGVISGRPTTVETASFTVRVTDAYGMFDEQAFSMSVQAQSTGPAVLTHAPMLGAVTDTTIRIWVRANGTASAVIQYQPAGGNWSQALTAGPINLLAENDFSGVVSVNALSPGILYDYRVLLDGGVQPESASTFKTLPAVGTASRFSFVFGADIHHDYQPHFGFDRMAALQPDFAMLLGDQMYIDIQSGTEMDFWDAYRNNRDLSFQNFARRVPLFTTWDDHDYGDNDTDQYYPLKAESRAALGKYWANPSYVEQNGSIYYKYSAGGAEFFMLDTRWNRDPGVTMLGAAQNQWLREQLLASTAKFKFIVSSVPWNDFGTTGNDSWIGYQNERSALFQFIAQNNIKNIVLLSGDQHWSGAFLIDYPVYQIGHNIQGFYEFEPTPLSAFTHGAPIINDPQILFLEDISLNYGLVRVDTTVTPARLYFEVRRAADNSIAYTLTVEEFREPSLTIFSSSLPDADWGAPYSQSLQAVGGASPYQWQLVGGSLPSGLVLNPDGSITGTPAQLGTFNFTAQVHDAALSTDSRPFTLTVNSTPLFVDDFSSEINGWTIVDEGTQFAPSVWTVSFGELVQGSNIYGGSLDGADPVKPGTYIYTGENGWTDYELRVELMSSDDDALGVMFRYQDAQNYYRFSMDRERAYRRLVKVVNGTTTILAQDSVTYQMGRWYDVKIRVLGNHIEVYLDGVLLFDVTDGSITSGKIALYSWGNDGSRFAQVRVTPLSFFIPSASLPDGEKGVPYSQTLKGAGGLPPYTWDLVSGSLPDGLALSSTGEISGIPTRIAAFGFNARVTDQELRSETKAFSIAIHPQSLFKDHFEGDLSQWTVVDEGTISTPSNWAISNGVLVQSSNIFGGSLDGADPVKPGTYLLAGDAGWTDYDLRLSLRSSDDDGIGAIFRYQDPQNYYRFSMDRERAHRRVTKTVGGVTTILAQDSIPYITNQWYSVKIRVVGNRIQVHLDEVLLFDLTDSSLPSGKIAVYCWAGENCYFDDLVVSHTTPSVTTAALPDGIVSRSYHQTLDASGGISPYVWSLIEGSLPSGLSFTSSGVISGTPTAVGSAGFTVQVTDAEGASASRLLSLNIAPVPPPNITTASLPEGTAGTSYSQILSAEEGSPPYQWSLLSGQLPPGLSLTASGEIIGTPTKSGLFAFTVRVEDTTAQSDTQSLGISIHPVPLIDEEFNGSLVNWTIVDEGTAFAPSVWTVSNGELVQSSNIYGGSTDGADPVKPGTYIYTGDGGWTDYELRVRLMSQDDDALGVMFRYQNAQNYYRFSMDQERAYRRLTKTVGGVTTVLAQDTVAYQMNRWYDLKIRVVGSQIQVYLDGGLLFDVTDSVLSSGKIALYSWGNDGSRFDWVKVNPVGLTIAGTLLPAGEIGGAYSHGLTASGGAQPYAWSLAAGALPPGLTLDPGGLISGTPTVAGDFGFTVTVQDAELQTDTKPMNLTIHPVVLFQDGFNNGLVGWTVVDEGTEAAPSAWTATGGQLLQSSNIYGGSTDGSDPVKPGTYLHTGNASWTDYEFSVRLRSIDDDALGIMFRYQDGQNYYRFSMDRERAYRRLVKVVNGTTTILAQDAVAYAENQWYDIKVAVVFDRIQVYVDGALIFDVVDPSIASGKIALYAWGNDGLYFDDVLVTKR